MRRPDDPTNPIPWRPLMAGALLCLCLTLPAPAAVTEPAKPTVAKPTVAKPTVKKPAAPKPATGAKAKKKPAPSAAAAAPAGMVAAAAATALASGAAAAPALPANADPALRNLEAEARTGNVEAQLALAEHFAADTPPDPADTRRSLYWYGRAAAAGDADAAWTLAELFRGGLAVVRDSEQAAYWYRQAAERGHAEAAFDLGLLHMEGDGVETDPAEAARWFEQAADAGIARAVFMLGMLFEQGVDGAPDPETAAGWYQRAAEGGDVNARLALLRLANGQPNIAVSSGPPPGMLGGPPGDNRPQPALDADEETGTPSASGAKVRSAAIPVDQAGVKEIQMRLIRLGHLKGKADGHLGKRTSAAIRAYQKSMGLKVDGTASRALLERMRTG